MATVTIEHLPDELHRALCARAATHGRSTEAEIRAILELAVRPPERLRMGAALAELGRRAGLEDEDITALGQMRGQAPAEPVGFE